MKTTERYCPVCGNEYGKEIFCQTFLINGFVQHVHLCLTCGMVYVNRTPTDDELARHYAHDSNYEIAKATSDVIAKWERTADIVRQYKHRGRVIEIGSANGHGLGVFKRMGYDVFGVEPSRKSCNIARQLYDIDTHCGMYDSSVDGKYDVAILSHVVEHLKNPVGLLELLKQNMNFDGVVYIEVPDLERADVPMGFFTFEHFNYFTPQTLCNLMQVAGYSCVRMEQFDGSAAILPFYPVIAGVFTICNSSDFVPLPKDVANSFDALKRYLSYNEKEITMLQKKISDVVKKYDKSKIAIYGAGIHTSQLLAFTMLDASVIFDSDTKKHGRTINNIPVRPFNTNGIKCIVISSRAFQYEIYDRIRYCEKMGIEIVLLYD